MAQGRGSGSARAWALFGGATGLAMLAVPARVAVLAAGPGRPPTPVIVRVLGARQVVQAGVVLRRPTRALVLAGAVVDLSHAASIVAAAVLLPAYRAPATASAVAAGASGAAGVLVGRS